MLRTYGDQPEETKALDFQGLESLRIFSKQILSDQETSLNYFAYYPGYQHFRGKQPDISVASSATCVLSLVATGKWTDTVQAQALLRVITSKKQSAGLRKNNPFTIAWILDAVESLKSLPVGLDHVIRARTAKMDAILQRTVRRQLFLCIDDNYFSGSTTTTLMLFSARAKPAAASNFSPSA